MGENIKNNVTDKGLISTKYRAHPTQYKKNEQSNLKKCAEDLNRHFP